MYNENDRQYLQMMQENISRMASNSANCKTWAVTIAAGLLAIGTGVEKLNGWLFISILPILVFWYLDTFYLHLERGMRNRQKDFINKAKTLYNLSDNSSVQEKQLAESEYKDALYKFAPIPSDKDVFHKGLVSTVDRLFSKSTAPFYGMLIAIVIIILIVLNWSWIVGLFNCKG